MNHPLASTSDNWTGNPDTDRATLINRARAATPPSPAPRRQSALPVAVDIILLAVTIVLTFALVISLAS